MYNKYMNNNKYTMIADKDDTNELIFIKDIKDSIKNLTQLTNKIVKIEITIDGVNQKNNENLNYKENGELIKFNNSSVEILTEYGENIKLKNINESMNKVRYEEYEFTIKNETYKRERMIETEIVEHHFNKITRVEIYFE